LFGCSEHIDECRQRRAAQNLRRSKENDPDNEDDDPQPFIVKPIIITEEPTSPSRVTASNQVKI